MEYTIDLQGKTFSIFFSKKQLAKGLEIQNGKIGLQEAIPELAIKDLVRGSFLGGGSINNPEKKYHLEIKFSQEESKRKVQALLQGTCNKASFVFERRRRNFQIFSVVWSKFWCASL